VDCSHDKTKITKFGQAKFVDKVDQITFSGKQALKAGQQVFYITDVGTFQLTEAGMVLIDVRAGIDVKKDILDFSPMKIIQQN